MAISVVKKSGEVEEFSDEKIIHSMRRVGLPEHLFGQVLDHIKQRVHNDQISTEELMYHINEFLEVNDKKAGLRYNLRRALSELGPSGFPFEKYLARIFESLGYKAETNLFLDGECVTHEIDLLIEKDGVREIVEAKFHNQIGGRTDLQDVLYTNSRFWDVKEKNNIQRVWIVTNTKLSLDARRYAECKGIQAVGWNYPSEGNLQDMVEQPQLYPITILKELENHEKTQLVQGEKVLCRDLLSMPDEELMNVYHIDRDRLRAAKESAKLVCTI